MNSKEKAEELFNKYFTQITMPSDCEGCMQCVDRCQSMVFKAKKYSLIAVDELLNHCYEVMKPFWQEVKQEINKL